MPCPARPMQGAFHVVSQIDTVPYAFRDRPSTRAWKLRMIAT
jgi:hypothetical protein